MGQYLESNRGRYHVMALCTFLGIGFILIFYGHFLGLNYGIFVTALLISFIWFMNRCKIHIGFNTGVYMVCALILAFSFVIHGNLFLKSLNFILVPLLLLWITIHPVLEKINSRDVIVQVFRPFVNLHRYGQTIGKVFLWKQLNTRGKGVLVGIVAALVMLFCLIPLMGSADEVFGYFLMNIMHYFEEVIIFDYIFQWLLALLVASYLFAYVLNLNEIYIKQEGTDEMQIGPNKEETVDENMIHFAGCTILTMINVVYFIFAIVQFKYLFLGNATNIPNFSYAQYARNGFFQMLVLTMINFLIVLISKWVLRDGIIARMMMSLLVLFNHVFIVSSFYRMHLYESTYGYTLLRLGVYLILTLETMIMFVTFFGIWNQKISIIKWSVLLTIFFYVGVNIMNIDAFIAKKNVDRYFRTGVIDMQYFYHLSYDAYPQMNRLMDSDNSIIRKKVLEQFKNAEFKRDYSWQEYNISRVKALEIVKKY